MRHLKCIQNVGQKTERTRPSGRLWHRWKGIGKTHLKVM